MGVKEDLAAAQTLLANNEKTQLQATKDGCDALVTAAKANLANLPDAQGAPSRISEFLSKVINNTDAASKEAEYLLNLYPKPAEA
jgi:hypothetical protein